MTCTSCADNCDPLVSDKCVAYTGPDIEALGICKGMSLFEVEKIILDHLQESNSAESIKIEGLTYDCDFTETLKPVSAPNLYQFAQTILTALCSLSDKIDDVEASANPVYPFNTTCLGGTYTSKEAIIQALVTRSCSQAAQITALQNESVSSSDLCTLVRQCIEADEEPPVPVNTQWNTRMVPYVYYPYGGPLSNFDNTGKGLTAANFDKVYLANGLNGTQDWRGVSPIGAIQNVPGAALSPIVDPAIPANASYNYVQGVKYGKTSVALTANEGPAHTHAVSDPGHAHFSVSSFPNGGKGVSATATISWSSNKQNGNQDYDLCYVNLVPDAGPTSKSSTGITIAASGVGQAHTNLHPTIGCLYIVYIP